MNPQAHYERLKTAAEFQPDGRLAIIDHATLVWACEQVEKLRLIVDMDDDWEMPVHGCAVLPEAGEERE